MQSRGFWCLLAFAVGLLMVGCSNTSTDGQPTASSSTTQPGGDVTPVVVVRDGSESMQIADAPGPRIAAARSAVTAFADSLPAGTPFGLTVICQRYGTTGLPRAWDHRGALLRMLGGVVLVKP